MTEGSASLVVEGTTSIHSRAKRLAVIHNPIAGRGRLRRYAAFLDALKARGLIVKELPTSCRGDAERWARQVSSAEGDMLVAAGGDGTINEVVNGLLTNRQGGRELPLAILPLGTANVLAAEIGLSDDIESCVDCIVRGEVRPITLGQMNDRCFLIMAGVGLDAHVVAQVDVGLKRKLGKLAYVAKLLQQLFTYDFPAYSVTIGDKSFRASSVIVAKGRYYGGRLMMAPRASLFQDKLQVVLFKRSGPWHAVRYGAALLLGMLPRLEGVQYLEAEALRIEGPAGDPVQADGDIIGLLPAQVSLIPQAIRLVVPVQAS